MCVTFLALAGDNRTIGHKYKLILLNNRDEVFARPTASLSWRDNILAGWDDKASERGTWLGMDRRGRVSVLLSITEPPNVTRKDAPSRGALVRDFLGGESTAREFLAELGPKAHHFNGFQFLVLDRMPNGCFEFGSLTNRSPSPVTGPVLWPNDGIYGFGNSTRDCPFRKVRYGEESFGRFIANFDFAACDESELVRGLFGLASDRSVHFPDEQIRQQTGCPRESDAYKYMCSLFVDGRAQGRAYGTRSSSVILVDADGEAVFHERRMVEPKRPMDDPEKWAFREERFTLEEKKKEGKEEEEEEEEEKGG